MNVRVRRLSKAFSQKHPLLDGFSYQFDTPGKRNLSFGISYISLGCGHVWEALSWLLSDGRGIRPLWEAPPLGRCIYRQQAEHRPEEQGSKQHSSTDSASGPVSRFLPLVTA